MNKETTIGRIERVSPGNRRLRVEMATSYRVYALGLSVLRCEQQDGAILRCRVETAKPSKEGLIVTVVAGVPRDTIAQLKNNKIVALTSDIVRDTEHYDTDELVGLRVATPTAENIGTVIAGFDTKANGMVEVELTGGASLLLPVVPEIVARVDWASNTLYLCSDAPMQATMDDENNDTALA